MSKSSFNVEVSRIQAYEINSVLDLSDITLAYPVLIDGLVADTTERRTCKYQC